MNPVNVLLLVEDDENDVIIIRRKMARSNVVINNLLTATTLRETKEILLKNSVDVIILDLNLPDSNGLNTLDEVLQIYSGVIIVFTSIDDSNIGVEAINHGADDFLIKNQTDEKDIWRSIYYSMERRKAYRKVTRIEEALDRLDSLMKGK
jgi:two-component system, NarL family, sensor histidine kinase UhpB